MFGHQRQGKAFVRRPQKVKEVAPDDDGASVSSTGTTYQERAFAEAETDTVDTVFHTACEQLLEKRGTMREDALTTLLSYYREDVREEEASENQNVILSRCINGVRRGSSTEAALSAQLLALHLITLQEPEEGIYQEASYDLQRAAASGESTEERCAAIDCMAMCCFCAASDDHLCHKTMERLRALWTCDDPHAVAAALRGWSFLLSRLVAPLDTTVVEAVVHDLAGVLQQTDVEVRGAAGEVLALLHSCHGAQLALDRLAIEENEGDGVYTDEDDGEDGQGQGDQDRQHESTEGPLGEVVVRLQALATGAHHATGDWRRSKRDRTMQRSSFRAVMAMIERDEAPITKIKLQHGDVVVVDTPVAHVQLNALRKALAGGFQAHMQHNPLMQGLFGFCPATSGSSHLTPSQKRDTRSPSSGGSRSRTAERIDARQSKASRMVNANIAEGFES